jgi:hypothetical protein
MVAIGAMVVGLVGVSASQASATGSVSIVAPASKDLGSGAPGTTITAAIGGVNVTDSRALSDAAWLAIAAESDFSDGTNTIPASDASYFPGSITTTGTITATGSDLTLGNFSQITFTSQVNALT